MKRKILVSFVIILVIVSIVIVYYSGILVPERIKFLGSMYVNDSGEPKGGFEWAGEYNLTITNKKLYLRFVLGLGNPIEKMKYSAKIISFEPQDRVEILIQNGSNPYKWVKVIFNYIENDEIWGIYNGYYIAYYVPPTIFPGLGPNYYVEMRILPEE